jgi:quinolinate synthase
VRVLAHPECRAEVVARADEIGSTERIIKVVEATRASALVALERMLALPG